jgi:hypothetical protein
MEGEQHLEERRAGRIALRLQALDQQRQGIILMGEGLQHRLAHLLQQRGESWVAGKLCPQDNRIDEVADQRRKPGPITSSGCRADEHVHLAGVARQQHLECRQ